MGYMQHHAIIVTSWNEARVAEAHTKAHELFDVPGSPGYSAATASITPVTEETMNGYVSFMVAPDGSKEGWDHSDAGDAARAAFIEWLRAQCHEDGSSKLDWVEVQFGDDEHETCIVNDSDEEARQRWATRSA